MKKILSIVLCITIIFTMSVSCFAFGTNGIMQKAKLKVGVNAQFPPFEYYDENGELYGFDIDLMNYIGERVGFDIEYVDMTFDRLIPAVADGEVACAISAISVTEERHSVIDYTIPYLSAKVTYFDGETSDTSTQQYAVVFPNNSAEKGKIYEAAGESENSVYNLVNNALLELIEDKTIEKLGEKYNLDKASDSDDFDYEYTVMPVPDNFDKINMDKSELTSGGQTSATSVVYSDWAKSDIEKAISLNIVNYGGNYNFTAPITREEFCELIYNYYERYADEIEVVNAGNAFSDTSNHDVLVLHALGIINGKSKTEFAPDDLLTREEAATILNRLINVAHPGTGTDTQYITFADSEDVSDWAIDSIQTIYKLGIMNGIGNNNFAPQQHYTTEQAIVTLVRMYSRFVGIERKFDEELVLLSSENTEYKLNSDISMINKEPVSINEGRGDGFHWIEHSYGDIDVKALIADDETTNIILISTSSSEYKTPRGIKAGDSLQKLQETYTEDLRKALSDDVCYVYEPPMLGFNRIYFYCTNDIISKIVIENGIDG